MFCHSGSVYGFEFCLILTCCLLFSWPRLRCPASKQCLPHSLPLRGAINFFCKCVGLLCKCFCSGWVSSMERAVVDVNVAFRMLGSDACLAKETVGRCTRKERITMSLG